MSHTLTPNSTRGAEELAPNEMEEPVSEPAHTDTDPSEPADESVLQTARKELLKTFRRSLPLTVRFLRLAFLSGPKVLFTSRITVRCATLMAMLCTPALVLSAIMTLPGLLFRSPTQEAYYYFSPMLNQDPSRWLLMVLTAVCLVVSMAVPASLPTRNTSFGY